jgi:hypothetical protein
MEITNMRWSGMRERGARARFERRSEDFPSNQLLGVRDLRRKVSFESMISATSTMGSHYSCPYSSFQGASLESTMLASAIWREWMFWFEHLWLLSGIIGRIIDIFQWTRKQVVANLQPEVDVGCTNDDSRSSGVILFPACSWSEQKSHTGTWIFHGCSVSSRAVTGRGVVGQKLKPDEANNVSCIPTRHPIAVTAWGSNDDEKERNGWNGWKDVAVRRGFVADLSRSCG